jgi:hypothetical protein
VDLVTQQQSKLMEPYGLGVMEVVDDLELTIQSIDPLQSLHLPEEPIGNKLLVDLITQQQSRLMEPYGFGAKVNSDHLETTQQPLD